MAKSWQKKRHKFEGGEELDPSVQLRIIKLEETIELMMKSNVQVPSIMTEELANLKRKVTTNKVNATKIIYNGTEYDSRREAEMAEALDKSGIKYVHQVEVELQPAFKLESTGESIRPIRIVVDFLVAGEWFVDIKGIEMQPFPIKWKMLKHKFRDTKKYQTLTSKKAIIEFIEKVKLTGWKDTLSL